MVLQVVGTFAQSLVILWRAVTKLVAIGAWLGNPTCSVLHKWLTEPVKFPEIYG